MGSDAKAGYGAAGRFDGLWFEPEDLVLEEDTTYELYDERMEIAVDENLVLNIMRNGVLQPVLVSKQGVNKEGKPVVVVVAGRQRVRAAREANKRLAAAGKVLVRVPAVKANTDDFLGVMISENELRRDDPPMTKARKLARYYATGRNDDDATIQFGVTKESLRQWKILLELHPDVQKAVDHRELPAHVAMKLQHVPFDEQPAVLEEMRKNGELKGGAGERAARGASGQKPAGATKLSFRITPTEVRTLCRTIEREVNIDALPPKARKAMTEIIERLTALEAKARGKKP